jgi:hypothetical protein
MFGCAPFGSSRTPVSLWCDEGPVTHLEAQIGRINLEWVAQVSLLRPGFLLAMGPGQVTGAPRSPTAHHSLSLNPVTRDRS